MMENLYEQLEELQQVSERVESSLYQLAIKFVEGDHKEARRAKNLKTVRNGSIQLWDYSEKYGLPYRYEDSYHGDFEVLYIPSAILKGNLTIEDYWAEILVKDEDESRQRKIKQEQFDREKLAKLEKEYLELKARLG